MSKELFLKALQEKYAKKTAKTDDGEGMDAPGAEDGDVDNDGDEDESDAYLLKRRKAIAKAMNKEEVELDESIAGAVIGGLGGHMLGKAYQGAAGSLAAKGAKALGKGMVGQTAARAAASKFAPAAGAAAGALAGHQATRKRRNEDLEEDFDMDLIMEEYGNEIYEATAELLMDEGIDWRELTEEELNEILGKVARAVGRGIKRQTIDRVTTTGRTARLNRQANKDLKKAADTNALKRAKEKAAAAKAARKQAQGPSTADKVRAATADKARKAGAAVKSTAKKLMQ